MTSKRVLVESTTRVGEQMVLTGPAAHHLITVLRVRKGDRIELRDGRGGAWTAEITGLEGRTVQVRKVAEQVFATESPLQLSVALAFARAERMDLVIRQATELGVHRLVAFRSLRSQYGLSQRQAETRKVRWLKIAREALCQCGRIQLPEIFLVNDVAALVETARNWYDTCSPSLKVLAWEAEKHRGLRSLWQERPECRDVLLVIGPEGGFAAKDVEPMVKAGFHTVQLGPRTLRFETAAVSLIAGAQCLWGDLG
jgi:16S rRNA (uracil1498-N3)-methyltransferase